MTVRAVVLPATPLLVDGAAGGGDVLATTREHVGEVLGRLLADERHAGELLVVAPLPAGAPRPAEDGPTGRRPSLAGAGVPDRWLPDLDGWPPAAATAHVPASVALLALGRALVARGEPDRRGTVGVLEVPGDASPGLVARVVASVRAASATVLAWSPPTPVDAPSGVPRPGASAPLAAVLAALRDGDDGAGAWVPATTTTAERGDHLPDGYEVVTWQESAASVPARPA